MSSIRPCRDDERTDILAIVNAAAEAYRGVIPADRWHEPYMDSRELDREIADRDAVWGYGAEGGRVGSRRTQRGRRMLVGTGVAADWAIRFYRRNGFELASPERKTALLTTYWNIPDR